MSLLEVEKPIVWPTIMIEGGMVFTTSAPA